MAKKALVETFPSKAALKKHERAEGVAIEKLEKARGEKDVIKATRKTMKSVKSEKKVTKSI